MLQILEVRDYLLAIIGIWLAFLSVFLIRAVGHYKKITGGAKNQNIGQILERIIVSQNLQTKHLAQIDSEFKKIRDYQKKSLQKYALIRFNPFEDTGGDQSFVVALLDGENSGIVISSLHSRDGTRVYSKPVHHGKPTNYQFSKEEKEVVEKAAQIKL